MRFISFIALFFITAAAHAEIIFSPALSHTRQRSESSGILTNKEEVSFYDFRLGYLDPSGLYLGAVYSMGTIDDDDAFSVGPTVGFSHYSGFYAFFSYYLMAETKSPSGNKVTDGMGPQVDIGWVFPLTSMFHIGPQISYRSIGYDKQEVGGATNSVDIVDTFFTPSVVLWFVF